MARTPITWLVTTSAPDDQGRETVLLGKAVYDEDGDLLTVSTFGQPRREEATQGGGHPLEALAKHLLRALHSGTVG